jgi:hypothetical protein
MSDSRIVIEIDYEPTLDCYPADVTTKLRAMEADVDEYHAGNISASELLDYAFDSGIDIRVEKLDR